MITLILGYSALETAPPETQSSPDIIAHAKRLGVKASEVILDKSYHYRAMTVLRNKEGRGRPDIIHLSLLEALGSPLNLEGLLEVYVHTVNDYLIKIHPQCRLPLNYNRFIGLMQKLFQTGRIEYEGKILLALSKGSLAVLFKKMGQRFIVALTRSGRPVSFTSLGETLASKGDAVVLIGGFPSGRLPSSCLRMANDVVCVDPASLDTWVVCSRVLAAYEFAKDIPTLRVNRVIQ